MNGEAPNRKKHVVLTDNELTERRLFQIILEQTQVDATLTTLTSGEKLLDMLRTAETLPDFIFLDLDMPLKNGIETLSEIRSIERLSKIPVMMYTSNQFATSIQAAFYNRADYYVIKPSDIKQMQAIFEWLIINHTGHKPPRLDRFVINSIEDLMG